jgi:hypothetical protein
MNFSSRQVVYMAKNRYQNPVFFLTPVHVSIAEVGLQDKFVDGVL